MAEFTTDTLMCKCIRPTRLYESPYDTTPSTMVLMDGLAFYSRKQYMADAKSMFYISATADNRDVPVGYWCPVSMISMYPVAEETSPEPEVDETGAIEVDETLRIKAAGAKTYARYSETATEPNGLQLGDLVVCDKKVEVAVNGFIETRYRIVSTTGLDQTLAGKWITVNKAVAVPNGPKVVMQNPYVTKTKMRARVASSDDGIMTLADEGGEVVNPVVTAPDGTELEMPDITDPNGGADGIVVNQVNMNDPDSMQQLYDAYGFDYSTMSASSLMSIPIGRMIFVHGMPFQYTYLTDRRSAGDAYDGSYTGKSSADTDSSGKAIKGDAVDAYGRTFAKEIASNMPIVVLAPGKPKFLTSVKQGLGGYVSEVGSDIKNTFLPMFSAQSDGEFGSILENLNSIEGDYQYYSMEIDTASYYNYVNSLCATSARLMGIGNVSYHGTTCFQIRWQNYNSAAEQDFSVFEQVMGLAQGVSFAYDPQSSVSDTMTNQTTESQFLSFFNDLSSKARELEFVTGYTGSGLDDLFDSESYVQEATGQLNTGAFAGLQNVVDRISAWAKNSIHGMNMRFPELWADSSHSRSYDLDMHFIAPYATAFCKWRYVLVPFFHIFALAAPKSDKNTSQYSSPFLIRAYSKGYFNVEMGIIESITWKRFGDGDMISEDGVPTQIDVSISFKDLYHTLAMTEFYGEGFGANISNFMNNTGLMDLIGTLSGVNMNRISISERISMFAASGWNAFSSLGSNFMLGVNTRVRNISQKLHLFGV